MTNFWKNKNIFITGINGFVGGNLAKSLIEKDANVFGLVRNQDYESFLNYENLLHKVVVVKGNILDKQLIIDIITENQIDYVFHFAAQVEVGIAIKNPFLTYQTNVTGSINLLDAVLNSNHKVKSVIVASSDKAYGEYPKNKMPYKENYPLIPIYPYDVSKACSDLISKSYSSEPFNLPIIITRFCNIYGPGQLNFSALIPDAIRSALGLSKFLPRGNGKQIRDYIYINDVIELYLRMAKSLTMKKNKFSGQIFNIGTNHGYKVREIIENIYKSCNNEKELKKIIEKLKNKKTIGEIEHQYMDYQKVSKFLKWKPKTNIDNGINESIEWYKKYFSLLK